MSEGTVVASGVAKRERIGIEQFMEAWQSSNSAAEAAEKLNTTAGAVSARASKERTGGLPLKHMPKGGGPKSDPQAKLAILAKLTGKTVEELQAEGDKLKAAAAQRAAERASK